MCDAFNYVTLTVQYKNILAKTSLRKSHGRPISHTHILTIVCKQKADQKTITVHDGGKIRLNVTLMTKSGYSHILSSF